MTKVLKLSMGRWRGGSNLLEAATVHVPAKDAHAITESVRPVFQAKTCRLVKAEMGVAVFAVGAGTCRFQSTFPPGTH